MSYTNINTSALSSAINEALNGLNSYNLNLIYNNLNSKDILNAQAKNPLNNALNDTINDTSINGSIINLKNKLNDLKKANEYIKIYQNLEKEIRSLEKRLYNHDGTKNKSIERQINSKKNNLKNYENKINNILS